MRLWWRHLEGIDDGLNVGLDGLVRELGAGQRAHALQGQVAQVGLPVLQELAQLVAGSHQQVGLTGKMGTERQLHCWKTKIWKTKIKKPSPVVVDDE